jgi:hypothetical protein
VEGHFVQHGLRTLDLYNEIQYSSVGTRANGFGTEELEREEETEDRIWELC